jgi:hypothetical protein
MISIGSRPAEFSERWNHNIPPPRPECPRRLGRRFRAKPISPYQSNILAVFWLIFSGNTDLMEFPSPEALSFCVSLSTCPE